jgi:hypothetical protein
MRDDRVCSGLKQGFSADLSSVEEFPGSFIGVSKGEESCGLM